MHTPGPWKMAEQKTQALGETFTRFVLCYPSTVVRGADVEICLTTHDSDRHGDRVRADARLIAAAPALLAALVDLLAHTGMEIRTAADRTRWIDVLDTARAAIALATGKE